MKHLVLLHDHQIVLRGGEGRGGKEIRGGIVNVPIVDVPIEEIVQYLIISMEVRQYLPVRAEDACVARVSLRSQSMAVLP
jgi:hypothetical protein